MQGILNSHFKLVEKYLYNLQQDEIFNLPCTHLQDIVAHEEKLIQIYNNYKAALRNIENLIKEFEENKKSLRSLIIKHKQCRK